MFRKGSFLRDGDIRLNQFLSVFVAAIALYFLVNGAPLAAQTNAKPFSASPGLSPLYRPSLPTGELGSFAKLRGLGNVLQPIEWKLPKDVVVSVAEEGAFSSTSDKSNVFGLFVGAVYRFQITNVSGRPNEVLYPTLEVVARLNPPQGKEWDFPIEIAVPQSDLEAALDGAFVTRAIFLENSENAANVDASENAENMTLDVPDGIDPVTAASTRGRVVAILRIGARAPEGLPTARDPFFFGLPKVVFRPYDPMNERTELEKAEADVSEVKAIEEPVVFQSVEQGEIEPKE